MYVHYLVCTAAYRFTVTAGHEDARRDCTVGVSVIAVARRRVARVVSSSSHRTAQRADTPRYASAVAAEGPALPRPRVKYAYYCINR